jgi:hypothetical protein
MYPPNPPEGLPRYHVSGLAKLKSQRNLPEMVIMQQYLVEKLSFFESFGQNLPETKYVGE